MKIYNFWIDPPKVKEFAMVSHAHLDHLKPHKKIFATRETIELSKVRLSKKFEGITINYFEQFFLWKKKIEFYPAGHILGASQILIENEEKRILYSGDFDYSNGFTRESIVVPSADLLIMDATYGSPDFIFPKRNEVISDFVEWVISTIRRGLKPVIYAYPIGKAQEIMKALEDTRYTLTVDKKIYEATKIYENLGVRFKIDYTMNDGDVVILSAGKMKYGKTIKNSLTAYLTGWSIKFNFPVDKTFPLSDHADFVDLLSYIEEVNPKEIHLINDRFGLREYLKRRGFRKI